MKKSLLPIAILACGLFLSADLFAQDSRSRRSSIPLPLLYTFPENPMPLRSPPLAWPPPLRSDDYLGQVRRFVAGKVFELNRCNSAVFHFDYPSSSSAEGNGLTP